MITEERATELANELEYGDDGADVVLLQRFLIAGGWLAATTASGRKNDDGEAGRLTMNARDAFLRTRGDAAPAAPTVSAGELAAFRAAIVNTMRSWARQRVRETSHNRGPVVDAIIEYGGGDKETRSAWCARAVSAALRIAADACHLRLTTGTSGAVRSLWQKAAGARVTAAEIRAGAKVVAGDILIRTRAAGDVAQADTGSWLGHTGVAAADYSYSAAQPWIPSIEGNTDGDDAAEGNGVYEKRRGMSVDDPRFVGIVRPSAAHY